MTMALHPEYPTVDGRFRMTPEWQISLPEKFNRRVEDGSLVLWKPELTFWINVWGNDRGQSTDERLAWILEEADPARGDERIHRSESLVRVSYELPEQDSTRETPDYKSVSGYVISDIGHVQISAYFDSPSARDVAYRVIESVDLVV